jgi:hypothetical protein
MHRCKPLHSGRQQSGVCSLASGDWIQSEGWSDKQLQNLSLGALFRVLDFTSGSKCGRCLVGVQLRLELLDE